ncbi:hypothetical protein WDU94_002750, partial [Cyamophila willieti]
MIKFCKSIKVDGNLKKEILRLLPQDVNGLIVEVRQESRSFFSFKLRLEISTKEDALAWIKHFEDTTLTSFKVNNTFPENTQKIIFKKNFHCQHNTRPKSCVLRPHEKHTKCRATLNIVVKPQMKRSRDPYLEDYPCEVNINWYHNHTIDYEALKYRRSEQLCSTFAGYYAKGHSPISALELHKIQLQTEYGQDFYKVAADGARCPNKIWCYKLYYKIFHRTCRELSSEDTVNALEEYVKAYNDKCGDTCAAMSKDMTTSDVVVSICSPLSKRVLTLKSVREVMLVTSSSNSSSTIAGNQYNTTSIGKNHHFIGRENSGNVTLTDKHVLEAQTRNNIDSSIIGPTETNSSANHSNLSNVNKHNHSDNMGNANRKRATGTYKQSCRVTFLLSPSVAGALPLGIIVMTSEREVLITKGIEMVKEMLKDPELSPKMIISDDSEPERNSLMKMFPMSAMLLCKTHVLQTVWRHLSDPKNDLIEHKLTIFNQFSTLLHS